MDCAAPNVQRRGAGAVPFSTALWVVEFGMATVSVEVGWK
jgi:hypothetical protein